MLKYTEILQNHKVNLIASSNFHQRLATPCPKLRYTAAQPNPFPFIFMYAHRDRQEQMWVPLLSKKDQVMIESRPLAPLLPFATHRFITTKIHHKYM